MLFEINIPILRLNHNGYGAVSDHRIKSISIASNNLLLKNINRFSPTVRSTKLQPRVVVCDIHGFVSLCVPFKKNARCIKKTNHILHRLTAIVCF